MAFRYTAAMARPRLIAWVRPEQETLLRDAIRTADVRLIGVCSDQRAGAADLGKSLGVEQLGELRDAIRHEEVDLLWLAGPVPLEADLRRLIRESGIRTISTEPRPGGITDLVNLPEEARTTHFVPLMRRSEGFRTARQHLRDLNPPHSVDLSFRARPEQGTLFARLFDAADLVDHLCGDVESVSATLADPNHEASTAGHRVPDSLFNFNGHMSINFHLAENRCASAVISNGCRDWFRGVTLLGDDGCLRITDRTCELLSETGESEASPNIVEAKAPSAGMLIGEQIVRLLDELDREDPPPNHHRLLALCEAARLSCRTGQTESPSRMLSMLSHV